MLPKFQVGDKVTAIEFIDCFQKRHEAITGLTVDLVRLIEPTCTGLDPYYRYRATRADEGRYAQVEGAEFYFTKEAQAS